MFLGNICIDHMVTKMESHTNCAAWSEFIIACPVCCDVMCGLTMVFNVPSNFVCQKGCEIGLKFNWLKPVEALLFCTEFHLKFLFCIISLLAHVNLLYNITYPRDEKSISKVILWACETRKQNRRSLNMTIN